MRDKKTGNAVDLGKRLGRRQACAQVAGRWRGGRCRMLAPALILQAPPRVGIGSVSGKPFYGQTHSALRCAHRLREKWDLRILSRFSVPVLKQRCALA
jgi:hypothetical protein